MGIRKVVVVLASVALAVGLLFFGSYTGNTASLRKAKAPTSPAKPNIVFILTDDMTLQDAQYMPKLKSLMMDKGTTFNNAFVTNSVCCPSRATILRGQYTHNHQVLTNGPPLGGYQKFHDLGYENSTVATWLQSGGYRTVLLGKYLNGYDFKNVPTSVPPGWDEWYAKMGGENTTMEAQRERSAGLLRLGA